LATRVRTSKETARQTSYQTVSSSETPVRLLLQRRGPDSFRRHALRWLARSVVLVGADIGAFTLLRSIVRLIRDDAIYGQALANAVASVFPVGLLGGTHFVVAMIIGLTFAGAYQRGDSRRDLSKVARGVLLAVALTLWTDIWTNPLGLVLAQGTLILALVWTAISIERLMFDAFLRFVYQTPADGDPAVFVGDRTDMDAQRIHDRLLGPRRARNTQWVHVRGRGEEDPDAAPVIAERLHEALSRSNADTVVLCGEYDPPIFEAIVECATSAGVRVLAVPRISGVVQEASGMVWYDGIPFVELTVPGFRGSQLFIKRAVDIAVSALGLILLSPLLLLVAIAIKLDSRGPALFTQNRVGYAGSVFRVLKFRTMSADADKMKASLLHLNASGDERLFKIKEDPRITKLGKFLRKWSIDEFPQLFNVLSGEMSLVGPRPFFESDLRTYLDHHFARLGAKPGITGLWQVKGRSSVTDFEEVVRLDREYIEQWSVWLDFWILVQTIPAVLRGRGAY
jgi:exopolysaccharide biosynthesis polyprenyl glycosylphosphotransferase